MERKIKKINLRLIKTGKYFKNNNKNIVPFHAWEITIFLALLGYFYPNKRAILFSAAVAHGLYLIQDHIPIEFAFLAIYLCLD
jgi:hypothetical protein